MESPGSEGHKIITWLGDEYIRHCFTTILRFGPETLMVNCIHAFRKIHTYFTTINTYRLGCWGSTQYNWIFVFLIFWPLVLITTTIDKSSKSVSFSSSVKTTLIYFGYILMTITQSLKKHVEFLFKTFCKYLTSVMPSRLNDINGDKPPRLKPLFSERAGFLNFLHIVLFCVKHCQRADLSLHDGWGRCEREVQRLLVNWFLHGDITNHQNVCFRSGQ